MPLSIDGSETYPIVDIRGSVNDLGPKEALAEGVAHRLALPIYVVNFRGCDSGYGIVHTLFPKQSPQSSSTA
jgi:hypothetical protein